MTTKRSEIKQIYLVTSERFNGFAFEGWIWVLIASVPDLSILFTFINLASPAFTNVSVATVHLNIMQLTFTQTQVQLTFTQMCDYHSYNHKKG